MGCALVASGLVYVWSEVVLFLFSVADPTFSLLALLKLFIGTAYMSQSFYGISRGDGGYDGGNNVASRSLAGRCEGDGCYGGYGYYGTDPSPSGGYGNNYGYDQGNGGGNDGTDVQLFCLWAGEFIRACGRLVAIAQPNIHCLQDSSSWSASP